MKFTDLFVKRPVLAIVVNLVILIAGLQAIRSLSVRQYPRSDIAVVSVTTVYVGANADLVRGFITTPLERVIASADRIDYMESGEGCAGSQRSAARGRSSGDRSANGGQPVRRHVSRVLVEGTRPEPDHGLPNSRGPAQAERCQRRTAGRHPG